MAHPVIMWVFGIIWAKMWSEGESPAGFNSTTKITWMTENSQRENIHFSKFHQKIKVFISGYQLHPICKNQTTKWGSLIKHHKYMHVQEFKVWSKMWFDLFPLYESLRTNSNQDK